MVLQGKLCGRVGRCREYSSVSPLATVGGLFLCTAAVDFSPYADVVYLPLVSTLARMRSTRAVGASPSTGTEVDPIGWTADRHR